MAVFLLSLLKSFNHSLLFVCFDMLALGTVGWEASEEDEADQDGETDGEFKYPPEATTITRAVIAVLHPYGEYS